MLYYFYSDFWHTYSYIKANNNKAINEKIKWIKIMGDCFKFCKKYNYCSLYFIGWNIKISFIYTDECLKWDKPPQ